LNNLAELDKAVGDYPKAEALLKEALAIYQKVLGQEHPDSVTILSNLAQVYRRWATTQKPNRCSKRL
jgi:hypothetical protein